MVPLAHSVQWGITAGGAPQDGVVLCGQGIRRRFEVTGPSTTDEEGQGEDGCKTFEMHHFRQVRESIPSAQEGSFVARNAMVIPSDLLLIRQIDLE
jgi:hypothetical protein